MRDVRLETKITEECKKKMNYLGYIYGLKYDNHIIERIVADIYDIEKNKEVTK